MQKTKQIISMNEALFFTSSSSISSNMVIIPVLLKGAGKEFALVYMISMIFVILLGLWTLRLAQRNPGLSILEIIELTTGKIFGRVVCAIYVLISIGILSLLTRYLCGFLQLLTLPNTPLWFTTFALLSLITFVAWGGIEVLGRLTVVIFIVEHSVFWIGNAIPATNIRFENIFPIFDHGILDFTSTLFMQVGCLSESVFFLLVMVTALPNPIDASRAFSKGVLIQTIAFILAVTIVIGGYGAELASHLPFPIFQICADIQLGKFIQGLEVLIQVAIILAVILNVSSITYVASFATTKIFNDRFPLVWLSLISIVVGILSNLIPSVNETIHYTSKLGPYVTLPFIISLLLLTTVGQALRRKKERWQKK